MYKNDSDVPNMLISVNMQLLTGCDAWLVLTAQWCVMCVWQVTGCWRWTAVTCAPSHTGRQWSA